MRRDALTSLHYSSNAAAATSGADARSNRSESPRPFLVMDYDDDNELDDDDDEIRCVVVWDLVLGGLLAGRRTLSG